MIRQIDLKADELLTREEAAALLKVRPHSLACMRSEGRGPAVVKLSAGRSGAVRYRRSDIERWLADPARIEAEAQEPWREARRQATAAKLKAAAAPRPRRRGRSRK
jgi:hypothetical protein